jgi:delta 1-pyrroline-5-carboxylate dehydrogenase
LKKDETMTYQSVNPYDGKILKTFEELSDTQLETALATAATCFETWRHKTFAERAAVVAKAATSRLIDGEFSMRNSGIPFERNPHLSPGRLPRVERS